jgi:hypothetical protein
MGRQVRSTLSLTFSVIMARPNSDNVGIWPDAGPFPRSSSDPRVSHLMSVPRSAQALGPRPAPGAFHDASLATRPGVAPRKDETDPPDRCLKPRMAKSLRPRSPDDPRPRLEQVWQAYSVETLDSAATRPGEGLGGAWSSVTHQTRKTNPVGGRWNLLGDQDLWLKFAKHPRTRPGGASGTRRPRLGAGGTRSMANPRGVRDETNPPRWRWMTRTHQGLRFEPRGIPRTRGALSSRRVDGRSGMSRNPGEEGA